MRMIVFAATLTCLACLLVLVLSLAWRASMDLTSPQGYGQPDPAGFVFEETPLSQAGLAYEDVSFTVPSGERLRGWLVPAAEETGLAMVVLHGRASDRRQGLSHLRMLHELGAAVLLFDMRENGLSDGRSRGTGLAVREAEDGIAGAQEMRRRGYDTVVAYGCSLGGSAAIIAAARSPDIDGVVAEASIARFEDFVAEEADHRLTARGIRASWATRLWGSGVTALTRLRIALSSYAAAEEVIDQIAPRPVLLLHGQKDEVVALRHAQSLKRRAGPAADLWIMEAASHCDGIEVAPREYAEQLAAFVARLKVYRETLP